MGNPAGVRRDFVGLEQRRREAAELLRQGVHQAEVARRVRAHRQSVSRWAQQLEEGGLRGLELAGVKKNAKNEGRTIVFIDESGLSQRPHRCRTWAPRGQTPVLQYHFNWKTLSAMAGVTWWNFYFRLYPGTIRSPQVIEFLTHLLRHLPGKLLIVWDGLRSHRSRMVWDFVRQQRGRLWLEVLPAYAPELTRSSTCGRTGSTMNCRTSVPTATENLVTTLAKHYGGCAAGPCWSARFGSRQSCFLCNYIM